MRAADAGIIIGVAVISDRLRAAVVGYLVGDAIGVPYEFGDHIDTVELRGHGTHNQPAGTWSDDGALMLALLDSLLSAGFDPEDQGHRILAWADDGAYAPGGVVFDIGTTTRLAIDRLRTGNPAVEAGGIRDHDAGNGSLMRILPVALVAEPDVADSTLVRRAHVASCVTHRDLRCQVACALYVLVARAILSDPDVGPDAALSASAQRLEGVYAGRGSGIGQWHTDTMGQLLTHRRHIAKPGGGYVLDSFWSAWEAFASAGSYRETVERAVRYGHDTDTTAAIAGGLAGLRWGLDPGARSIPRDWLQALRGREIVDPLVDWLEAAMSRREPRMPAMDPDWPYAESDLEAIERHDAWMRWHPT